MITEDASGYRCGKKINNAKKHAKKRHLGFSLLMPLEEGEVGHHVTDKYVIGVPKGPHEKITGNREGHRRKVLNWLKINDRRKYTLVVLVLKNHSSI